METVTFNGETVWGERRSTRSVRIGTSNVDLRSGAAQSASGTHHLRRKKLDLLTFLYQSPGAIFSRDEIAAAWLELRRHAPHLHRDLPTNGLGYSSRICQEIFA